MKYVLIFVLMSLPVFAQCKKECKPDCKDSVSVEKGVWTEHEYGDLNGPRVFVGNTSEDTNVWLDSYTDHFYVYKEGPAPYYNEGGYLVIPCASEEKNEAWFNVGHPKDWGVLEWVVAGATVIGYLLLVRLALTGK